MDECGVCGGEGIAAGTCDCAGSLPNSGYDCDGVCLSDSDGDAICDENEINGCIDELACNYDVAATDDDDSCSYTAENYDCAGNCLIDTDNDGVCDANEILGCTVESASNYSEEATEDDASCLYSTTLNVDMSCAGIEFSTVHVTGPFCGWCGSDGC